MDPTSLFEKIVVLEGGDIGWRDEARTWPVIRLNGTQNSVKTNQGWMLIIETKNIRATLHIKADGTRCLNKSDFILGKFSKLVTQLGGKIYPGRYMWYNTGM